MINYRKTIVISAVNLTEGGPLTVLKECLASAVIDIPIEFRVIALVNNCKLIQLPRIEFIYIPSSKKSWIIRMYWEWFGFMRISKKTKPALWLSLHDITPRVSSFKQAVYCHNASPFYSIKMQEILFDTKFLIFNLFYKYLYLLFISRNEFVIVQQSWLRIEFCNFISNLPIIVAHPSISQINNFHKNENLSQYIFFYPAFPRVFKNIETLCEAVQILISRGVKGFEVRITIEGSENKYSRWLKSKFGVIKEIKFLGQLNANEMNLQYSESSAVVFPSKLETWGLPISEAKIRKLPLFLADLPYARETVGDYDLVSFFDIQSSEGLANTMHSFIEKRWIPEGNKFNKPKNPYASNWKDLWAILINSLVISEQ